MPTIIQHKRGDTADLFDGVHQLEDAESSFSRNTTLKGGPQDGHEVKENYWYAGDPDETTGNASFVNSKDMLAILHYQAMEIKKLKDRFGSSYVNKPIDYKNKFYFYNRGIISGAELYFPATGRDLYLSAGSFFGNGKVFTTPELSLTIPTATVTGGNERKRYIFLKHVALGAEETELVLADEKFAITHTWASFPKQVPPQVALDVSSAITLSTSNNSVDVGTTSYIKTRNYIPSSNIDDLTKYILIGAFYQSGTDTGGNVNNATKATLEDFRTLNKGVYGKYAPEFPNYISDQNSENYIGFSYNYDRILDDVFNVCTIGRYLGNPTSLGDAYLNNNLAVVYDGTNDFVEVYLGRINSTV